MHKFICVFLTLFFVISCQNSKTETSNKTEFLVPCTFIEGLEPTNELQCGKISVPENHEDPKGKTIEISYVIIRARDTSSSPYPMIFLSGGPGGASLTSRISGWLQSPLRDLRDIILFDQRGIGHSSALPNINEEFYDIFAKNASAIEEQSLVKELLTNYRQQCEEQNIHLQFYNSFQNAKDVGMLMKHLNYGKYNLYGVSYGTRLARVIQELFPDLLNSVILNSPNPMKGDFLIDRLKAYSLALERVLAYCEKNPDCNKENPNLEEEYFKVISSLEETPLEIDIDGKSFFLNAQDGIFFIRRKLYGTDSRTGIPALIEEYKAGGGPIIKELITYEFEPDYNFSMWLAVERNEMYNPENTAEVINKVYESLPLLPVKLGLFSASYLALGNLHDGQISEEKKNFLRSSVPTMITVNQYDPVTPPENGQILMESLSNGQLFILDEGGHGGGDADCRNKVMIAFMDSPNSTLDASCLNLYVE